jgi:hypothetical protein
MPDLDYRGLAAEAQGAVRQPDFGTVQRRAGQLRTRRRLVAGAVTLVAAAGAAGLVTVDLTGGLPNSVAADPTATDRPQPPPAHVRWAGAADASHLYVVVADCQECPQKLHASTDGGRTWQLRGDVSQGGPAAPQNLRVINDSVLVSTPSVWYPRRVDLSGKVAGDPIGEDATATAVPVQPNGTSTPPPVPGSGIDKPRISVDGGRTWADLEVSDTAVPAVAAGGAVVNCQLAGRSDPCRVWALDPAIRRIAPLASQPPVVLDGLSSVATPRSAGIWVQGYEPQGGHAAVAVSRDAGRSWTTSRFDAETPALADGRAIPDGLPYVATTDGRTAYAMFTGGWTAPRIYRSTDGGAHWQRTNEGRPMTNPLNGPLSMVTRDGSHVVVAQINGEPAYFTSADGATYRHETLGLPRRDALPEAVTTDSYLVHDRDRLYLSADGRNWRPVPVP